VKRTLEPINFHEQSREEYFFWVREQLVSSPPTPTPRFAQVFSFKEMQVSYFFPLFQKSRYVLLSPFSKSFLRYLFGFLVIYLVSLQFHVFRARGIGLAYAFLPVFNNTYSCIVDFVDNTCFGSCTYNSSFLSG
jgi:hypothetical protein